MNTTVATYDPHKHQLSAGDVRSAINLVQEVMQDAMKEGVHYGKIPGTDKPTLYKPGAEKLCATFRIAPTFEVEELPAADGVRYRVRCRGTHQTTGIFLGEGMGSCSSLEEKYKWRRAVVEKEWDETPEERRRIKYARKRDGGTYKMLQVRTDPADLDNTVLKMAVKRALVAMVLNVTAASDIFHQDIEDLPAEYVEQMADDAAPAEAPPPAGPRRKSERNNAAAPVASKAGGGSPPFSSPSSDAGAGGGGGSRLTPPQRGILEKRLAGAGLTEAQLRAKFKAGLGELTVGQFNDAMKWIKEATPA